jgi:putative ABC transport system permease protein
MGPAFAKSASEILCHSLLAYKLHSPPLTPWAMDRLLPSLRYTIRLLLKSPGFAIACVLILGFGIGANAAIFSLINAVILKPLPYPNPDRLVQICQPTQDNPFFSIDYPDFVDMVAAQHTFDSLAVAYRDSLDLSSNGEPEHLEAAFVSPSMFKVSGLPAVLGRVFTEKEDIPNGPLLAVLSEHCWKTRFHSDAQIIGKNLKLSDHSFQVIGVLPAQVSDWGPPSADVYVPANTLAPLGFLPNNRGYPLALRDLHLFFCVGRLKAGVSVAQAQADLEIIHNNLLGQYPDTNRGFGLRVIPLLDSMVNDYTATTWLLGAAVSCLLLISCANVANLQFARGLQRRREMTIRATLGATRWRLIGQLVLETMFLSAFGGILGLSIALGSAETIKKLSPPNLYRFQELSVDLNALVFVFGIIILTSLLAGLLPAWSLSRVSLVPALKEEGGRAGTSGPQRHRTQSALVGAQVALACMLLIGTGLLVRSFQAAQNAPLGFNPHHLLTLRINLNSQKYETDGVQTRAFWDALISKICRLPGVTEAGMTDCPPLMSGSGWLKPFTVNGQPMPDPDRQPNLVWQQVSSNFFRTMQVPILQGRDFDSQDTVDKHSVVVVDESLAEHYFPNQNPLGKGLSLHDPEGVRDCTIVGVVPHLRYKSPGVEENAFQAYFPYSQWDYDGEFLILRSDLDPAALVPSVREAVASIDPGVPIYQVNTYDDFIALSFVTRKLSMLLVTLFSGAALFLSAIGLYGTLAYTVGQRTREIGIRIALGAQSDNILRLITAQGLKIVGVGLVTGIGGALVVTHLIQWALYGVAPIDPISFGVSVVILGIAAVLACLLPALRAARINPIKALRE